VGFLVHNFYPARIFLGDSGSLLIGFTLAVVSVQVDVKRSLFVSLSVPIMVMGVPIMDVALSILRRRRMARPVFQGDRSHLHHRLQQVGLSHRSAVLFLWICAAYLNTATFFIAKVPNNVSGYIYASVVPTLGFWLMTLYFVEKRLSFQAARFSRIFIKHEDAVVVDRAQLVEYMSEQVRDCEKGGKPFVLVAIDCADFMKEMAHESPQRMVGFYMNLCGILRSRVRSTDLVARVHEHRFVAVLAGAGGSDGSDLSIIDYISSEVKKLQEAYRVFQSHPRRPEGFRILRYPKDGARIWQALAVAKSEVSASPERVARAA
jgi:GGDEF domain-containing protein